MSRSIGVLPQRNARLAGTMSIHGSSSRAVPAEEHPTEELPAEELRASLD